VYGETQLSISHFCCDGETEFEAFGNVYHFSSQSCP
jgi:hypothetical protein